MDERKAMQSAKRLAIEIIMYQLGEAWHGIESPYYDNIEPLKKEMIKSYIHYYGHLLGRILGKNYVPH